MSDPCLPPPNTAPGSVHVLQNSTAKLWVTWTEAGWHTTAKIGDSPVRVTVLPAELARAGWRYLGGTTSPERRLLTSMQRKGGERTRAKLSGKNVRIWSDEHGAWWRPERAGYTTHIEAAGVYSADDAWCATRHCGPGKRIAFVVVETKDAAHV